MNGMNINVSDLQNKFQKLRRSLEDPTGVFSKTVKDMQSRAPGKVADAVREIFSIKKADIMPTQKKLNLKKAGTIRIRGYTIANLKLYYEGRVLTPLHFGFTPKNLPEKGKKYSLKLKVKKIKKKIKSPTKEGNVPFVAPAARGSDRIIPWLRYPDGDIHPIRTLSLPQMVDNSKARKIMNESLSELLHNRFNHNLQRHLSKTVK